MACMRRAIWITGTQLVSKKTQLERARALEREIEREEVLYKPNIVGTVQDAPTELGVTGSGEVESSITPSWNISMWTGPSGNDCRMRRPARSKKDARGRGVRQV